MPTLNQRRREATRLEVATAALGLFARDGYHNVTAEMIADASGVSPRTFYRYFSGKSEVLGPFSEERARGFAAAVAARPTDESVATAVQGAIDTLTETWRGAGADSPLVRVLTSTPELYARWQLDFTLFEQALAPVVRDRLETACSAEQVRYTTVIVVALLRALFQSVLTGESTGTFSDRLAEALRYAEQGAGLA